MRYLFLMVLFLSSIVFAFDTYRVGSRIIRVGDSMATLQDVMGEPVSKDAFTNEYGAPIGMFWYYQDNGKTIKVLVIQGAIKRIEEVRQ